MKKLLLFLMVTSVSFAGEFDKEEVAQLKAVIEHNLKAMNEEKIDEYMKDIHPLSPAFPHTRPMIQRVFNTYDLNVILVSMRPLMIDKEYFIVRAKQRSTKVAGERPFQNNITDAIHVYKKHKDKWLLWSSMILEVEKLAK